MALSRLKGHEAPAQKSEEEKMINKVVQDQQHKSGCCHEVLIPPLFYFTDTQIFNCLKVLKLGKNICGNIAN